MKKFRTDERGNIALLFGLTLIPMVGAAGVAIDYSAASNMQSALQSEADATVLEAVKVAVDTHTDPAHANKTQAQRQALIDAKMVNVLASRTELARARSATSNTDFTYSGSWVDTLKSEYRVVATVNVKRYARLMSMSTTTPVSSAATAKMAYQGITTSATPSIDRPGYEAGDYNRIYAYCYNDALKSDPTKARTQMTAVSSNGQSGGSSEVDTNDIFKNIKMPECDADKGETLSWRLYNIRGARTDSSRWPTDKYNKTTKLWTQKDDKDENTTGSPTQRTLFNYYSDTKINADSGLESYQFNGDQLGYMASINMMETMVCNTKDECTPGKPGYVAPVRSSWGTPQVANQKCAPGKFMYLGWEDRPFIPGRPSGDYSNWGSGYWTDGDYDDIRLVISCPETTITSYTKKVSLIR